MFEAARLSDGIAHTSALAGFIAGAIIGVALIVAAALIMASGGLAAIFIGSLVTALAPAMPAIGQAIGSMFQSSAGSITSGSFNVFTNSKNAAHVQLSTVACSKDSPTQMVAEGSGNVFINSVAAARKDDSITCGAKISSGSGNVFIGGGTVQYLPVQSEVPEVLKNLVSKLFSFLEIAMMAFGIGMLVKGLLKCGLRASLKAFAPCAGKFVMGLGAGMVGGAVGNWLGGQATSIAGGQVGNPVQVTTGNKLLLANEEIDVELIGPLSISIDRFYNSSLDDRSALGRGWRLPWELSLSIQDDAMLYTDRQGRSISLPKVPQGEKLYVPSEQLYLSHLNDGRWVVSDLSEIHYVFTAHPQEATENSTNFLLTHIEDNLKNCISLERNIQGLVTRLTDSIGQQLTAHYQTHSLNGLQVNRLQRIERTAGGTSGDLVQYGYDQNAQLISVTNAIGEITRRFVWGESGAEQGLLVEHSHAVGLSCHYRWQIVDAAPRVVEHHTNDGERYLFTYDIGKRQCRVQDLSIPEQPAEAQWQWDEFQQITHCNYFDGRRYQMEYDVDSNLTHLHLPTADSDKPRIARFEYDTLGRINAEISPEGLRTERDFAPDSLRVQRETLANGSTWLALYEPNTGVILQTEDPLGAKTEYTWETPFGPSSIKNALGKSTQLTWNSRGQLLKYTDCSGKSDNYQYDDNGNLITLTDALGQTTTYNLDNLDRIESIIHPDNSTEYLTWNKQGLLAAHTNPAGHSQQWRYTLRGQIQQHQDAAGKITQAQYNSRQQLTEITKGSARHRFAWDATGRLVAERHPDNMEQRYHYNAQGWLFQRDTLGASIVPNSTQREKRSRFYQYDADGRLLTQKNNTSTLTYSYTSLGLLHTATRTPTAVGMELGLGIHNLRFSYDKLGRMLQEAGENGELNYSWDALSNLQNLSLPQGQRLNYHRYGSGHVHGMSFNDLDIVNFERDDLHREVMRSQGQLSSVRDYDKLGRLTQQRVEFANTPAATNKPIIWRNYRYNSAFELEQITDFSRGTLSYHYDPAGRLLASNINGQNERFHWDDADNLLSPSVEPTKPSATVQGNRLLTWLFNRAGIHTPIANEYDAFGRLTVKQSGNEHQTQQLVWDDEDQLIAVSNNKGTTRFEYDPLGRRIAKHHQAKQMLHEPQSVHSTHFVWEGMRLLQEIDNDSKRIRSWLYDPAQTTGYTPLACIDQFNQDNTLSPATVFYAQTDQLGTIQELTDTHGQVAWSAQYSTWGQRQGQAIIATELKAPLQTDCQLRFQGQYEDLETGLHYNTFRYYDPEIGRFICADPIGVAGGFNLYQYAPNPTRWIDPLGWDWNYFLTNNNGDVYYHGRASDNASLNDVMRRHAANTGADGARFGPGDSISQITKPATSYDIVRGVEQRGISENQLLGKNSINVRGNKIDGISTAKQATEIGQGRLALANQHIQQQGVANVSNMKPIKTKSFGCK